MKNLIIEKSRLEGAVNVAGAKNSALRLLAASILTDEDIFLDNFPVELLDAQVHFGMLRALGKEVNVISNDSLEILSRERLIHELNWKGRSIRNTLLILGALFARFGQAKVPLPGGCQLGDRGIDIHVDVLEAFGAKVWCEGDHLCVEKNGSKKNTEVRDIKLRIRSTGATENAIIIGAITNGTTRVWNPHIRPEIMDLIKMLKDMGARINVFGQEHIEIIGVGELSGAHHTVIPDNMEAVTWLTAAVMTEGEIEINNFPYRDLEVVTTHLVAAGAQLYRNEKSLIVKGGTCYPLEVSTGPHPGINSDVQPLLAAWAMKAKGESRIIDLRFPGRYAYSLEFNKLGGDTEVVGDMLVVRGNAGAGLVGTNVIATDLRAGAALALCGLISEGVTRVEQAWQIERGYVGFHEKLEKLGAKCSWES